MQYYHWENLSDDLPPEVELFAAVEKVNIDEAVGRLSDKWKEGLPELKSEGVSEWYEDESEVNYENCDVVDLGRPIHKQINYDDWMKHRQCQMKNSTPFWGERMKSTDQTFAVHKFTKLTKEEQKTIYEKEIARGSKLPPMTHPAMCQSSVKEIIDQWREYNGEYVGNSTVDFEELLPELDKRFEKLRFAWKYGNLQISWKEGILEHSQVQVSKINMHALEDIAKSMHKITGDETLIKELLINMIARTLEEVF